MSKKRELMNLVERITENEAEIFLKCTKKLMASKRYALYLRLCNIQTRKK